MKVAPRVKRKMPLAWFFESMKVPVSVVPVAPPTISRNTFPAQAGRTDPSPAPSLAAPGTLVVAQLISMFELHRGFVPGCEFEAEGFSINDLVARGLIFQSTNHLDGGCYIIGETLRKSVQRQ